MKVLAIMGSPRHGQTDKLVGIFERHLKACGDVNFTYIYLRDAKIEPCKGCAICLEKGEEFCPFKQDEREAILKKMHEAKGIIFATPNYSLQVSGLMKNFFDRLCFIFHRPCFFRKTSISLVIQGVYGGKDILEYLDNVAEFWGFTVAKGLAITVPGGGTNPHKEWPPAEAQKIEREVQRAAERFYKQLIAKRSPEPSLKRLLLFRVVRSLHKYSTERSRDYAYYKEQGWFDSVYFYDTRLGLCKRVLGNLVDKWQARQTCQQNKNSST